MKKIVVCFVVALLWVGQSVAAENSVGPMETLKPILTDLANILIDSNYDGEVHRVERRAKIMEEVHKGFDFQEMSKRVLGRTWRDISSEQQEDFTELMTKLLENVYVGKFEEYEEEADKYAIEYIGELVRGGRAQVTTEVVGGDQVLPVHYIMHNNGGKWMVYDINLEGMSLIRNYQEQFRSILRTEDFEGLVKIIEEKIVSLEQE